MIPFDVLKKILRTQPKDAHFLEVKIVKYEAARNQDGTQKVWQDGKYGAMLHFEFVTNDPATNGSVARVPFGSLWDSNGVLSPAAERMSSDDLQQAVWRQTMDYQRVFRATGLDLLSGEVSEADLIGRTAYVHWLGRPSAYRAAYNVAAFKYGNLARYDNKRRILPWMTKAEYDERIRNNVDPEIRPAAMFHWRNQGSGPARVSAPARSDSFAYHSAPPAPPATLSQASLPAQRPFNLPQDGQEQRGQAGDDSTIPF